MKTGGLKTKILSQMIGMNSCNDLLENDEISRWLFEDGLTEGFLQKKPALLERRTEFEQMSLFQVENSK